MTKRATYKLASNVPEEEYKDEAITSQLTEEQSLQEQIDRAPKSLTDDLKFRLLDLLKNLPLDKFERLVLELLKKMGYGEPVETKKNQRRGNRRHNRKRQAGHRGNTHSGKETD